MHPELDKIVERPGRIAKYIYLCTNSLLLRTNWQISSAQQYLTCSFHSTGPKEGITIFFPFCREGGYERAIDGRREA